MLFMQSHCLLNKQEESNNYWKKKLTPTFVDFVLIVYFNKEKVLKYILNVLNCLNKEKEKTLQYET